MTFSREQGLGALGGVMIAAIAIALVVDFGSFAAVDVLRILVLLASGVYGGVRGAKNRGLIGALLGSLAGVFIGYLLASLAIRVVDKRGELPQTLVNGLTRGSVYALIALGYSMVYGILKLLNFAHGDIYMVGAYLAFGVFSILFVEEGALLDPVLIIAIMLGVAMLGAAILSVAVERFAYRPLRYAPRIAPLISALGISFILQNLVQIIAGPRPESYGSGTLIATDAAIVVGDMRIHHSRVLVVAVTVVLMLGLTYFVRGTKLGRAMRAVSMDLDAAQMMGVDVNQVVVITFFIGAALAGAGGVLQGIVFFTVRHTMGFIAGLKGFTAAVVGGIGSVPGAAIGGLLLGMAEAFSPVFISAIYTDAIAFALLMVFLLLRPSGLMGKPTIQKA